MEELIRKVDELQDVVASLEAHAEIQRDQICQILLEGENTEIGKNVTLERIKDYFNFDKWLTEEE